MNLTTEKMNVQYIGLAWEFHVNPDSCKNPSHYEDFLRFSSVSDDASGLGVTHIFLDIDNNKIAGFITLKSSSIITSCDGTLYGEPALEISELAVDQEYEGKNIGRELVDIAMYHAFDIKEKCVGIRHVILCADPQSVGFYSKLEFSDMKTFYNIPRNGWNNDCIPMFAKIAKD